jgi:oligopeptide transport system ATP-binding protein
MSETLLSVQDLSIEFGTEDGVVHAVDHVSFDITRGEVFAIVGESGSGKSVTAMSVLRLLPEPPAKVTSGRILWKGNDVLTASPKELRAVRGDEIAMIFQDPLTALNPVHTIGRQITEVLHAHRDISRRAAMTRAAELLGLVGIPEPAKRVESYPHEFSGGMRQRAMIAMAIACDPDLLIADEPTTALDVTVQAQVLEVLLGIKDELNSAIVLITHDLGVVAGIADRVMVMYAGRMVETGTADELFYESSHPYTRGLLDSLPTLDGAGAGQRLTPIPGQPPSLIHTPSGCAFHPRCSRAVVPGVCETTQPGWTPIGNAEHLAACHFASDVHAASVAATAAFDAPNDSPAEPVA